MQQNALDEPYCEDEAATHEPMDPIEPPLTEIDLADLLRVPCRILAKMRRRNEGPPWVACGPLIRYPAAGVRRFLANANARSPVAKE